jgi:hypothetical protein
VRDPEKICFLTTCDKIITIKQAHPTPLETEEPETLFKMFLHFDLFTLLALKWREFFEKEGRST